MKSEPSHLLIVTNLYPLPWEPNRATFNRQQFQHLEHSLDEDSSIRILIPVAWPEWVKHRAEIQEHNQSQSLRYIIPYFYLPKFGRRFYSRTMLASLLLAWRWIKQQPVTHLLASWAYPEGVACQALADWLGVPYSIKVHGSDINMHCQSKARRRQVVKAANAAHSILCVSQALKQRMLSFGIAEQKMKVIYNGVDQIRFQPAPEVPLSQRKQLIFVGNLKPDKGVFELLEAFALLHTDTPEYSLHYYGSGTAAVQLQERIQQLNLEGKVTLHGSVAHDRLPELFNRARLLLLPSYHEGVPNVLLEAMASGVPSVATQVGGIPEILEPQCGVLIEQVADIQATYNALKQALQQQWQQQTIRATAARFDWQNNATATRRLLLNHGMGA